MYDKVLKKIALEKIGFKEFLSSGSEPYSHQPIETVRLGEEKIEGPTNPHEWPAWYNVAELMWRPFAKREGGIMMGLYTVKATHKALGFTLSSGPHSSESRALQELENMRRWASLSQPEYTYTIEAEAVSFWKWIRS